MRWLPRGTFWKPVIDAAEHVGLINKTAFWTRRGFQALPPGGMIAIIIAFCVTTVAVIELHPKQDASSQNPEPSEIAQPNGASSTTVPGNSQTQETTPSTAATASCPRCKAKGWYENANAADSEGDFATAVHIVWPLAAQRNAKAQSFLGMLYFEGWGVPQDYKEAFNWFRRAADQGDYKGQSWLSLMYRDGNGVPQDKVRAYLWANLAAQSTEPADAPGQLTPGQIEAEERDKDIAQFMTPKQLAEARRLAADWKPEPVTEPLPRPEDIPNVRSYQTRLNSSPTEQWVTEGDRGFNFPAHRNLGVSEGVENLLG